MGIATEYEELAVELMISNDLSAITNALKFLAEDKYKKGYRDGFRDRCRAARATRRAIEKDFQEEREVIEDVMSAPFNIDHQ